MREFNKIDGSYKDEMKKQSSKLAELQAIIQARDLTIRNLEGENKELSEKAGGVDEQIEKVKQKNHEDIERAEQNVILLNHKVASYEHKLINLNQYSSLDFQVKDFQSNQIFEQRVIYELKTEN